MDTENIDAQTVRRRRPAPPHSRRAVPLSPRLAAVPPQEGGSSQQPAMPRKPKQKRFKRETLSEPEKIKRAMDRPPPLTDMAPPSIVALFTLVAQAKSVRHIACSSTYAARSVTRACASPRAVQRG